MYATKHPEIVNLLTPIEDLKNVFCFNYELLLFKYLEFLKKEETKDQKKKKTTQFYKYQTLYFLSCFQIFQSNTSAYNKLIPNMKYQFP